MHSMIFDPKSSECLRVMGIEAQEYEQQLAEKFGHQGLVFQSLLQHFWNAAFHELDSKPFNNFYAATGLPTQGDIYNCAYDLFSYLKLFKSGGKLALYKHRQADWKGPIVRLSKSDYPNPRFDLLAGIDEIYRGMSIAEFESKKFGQSWTADVQVAKRFAVDTYEDQRDGVVAVADLDMSNVIYVFPDDPESEVVVVGGSITSVNLVNA